jgi:hypothetical protein
MAAFIKFSPDALLASIFQEFLDCTDLAELDSALCSKAVRNVFLTIISDDSCVMSNYESFSSVSFLNWLSIRSIFFKHLFINHAYHQMELILRKVEMLEILYFENYTILSKIINQCESLISVTMEFIDNEELQSFYGNGLLSQIDDSIWEHLHKLMFITGMGHKREELFTVDLINYHLVRIIIGRGYRYDAVVYILFKSEQFNTKDIISDIGIRYETPNYIHFEACGVLYDLWELMIFIKDHRYTNVVSVVSSFDDDNNTNFFQFQRKSPISYIRMRYSEQVFTTDIEIIKQAMSVSLDVGSIELNISGYDMVALNEIQNLFRKSNRKSNRKRALN